MYAAEGVKVLGKQSYVFLMSVLCCVNIIGFLNIVERVDSLPLPKTSPTLLQPHGRGLHGDEAVKGRIHSLEPSTF